MSIDPRALVSREAEIGGGVEIGPFAVIEPGVRVGEGCRIAAHAVLKTGLRLGPNVRVAEGAVLGGDPQDVRFAGGESFAEVEEGAVIREYATIHRSALEGATTRVGRGALVMAYGHVAHDCDIGEGAIIASYAALAGHIRIGPRAFVSGGVVIHQHSRVGELAMIGGGSKINLDVPPYFTVDGVPGRAVGLNLVGLRRAGVGPAELSALKEAYRLLYRSKLALRDALERIEALDTPRARALAAFVRASERGICRDRSGRR